MIEDSVRLGELDAVRAATKDLGEPERRRLSRSAIALLREVRQALVQRVVKQEWPYPGQHADVLTAAQVYVLATVTPAELRKVGPWGLPRAELAFQTLVERSTALDQFVDVIAEQVPTRWGSGFELMRSLVRAGKIQPPANPGYIQAMIAGLDQTAATVYAALRADPGLLEHELWQLFEVEGSGEASLAAHDKYAADERTWMWALWKLSAEGQIARARLLDASLAALGRDFAAFRAGWFARFHERLQPTNEERQEAHARLPGVDFEPDRDDGLVRCPRPRAAWRCAR